METLPDKDKGEVLNAAIDLNKAGVTAQFSTTIQATSVQNVLVRYKEFVEQGQEGATFTFWSSYLNMIELLLLHTRATRTGHWQLHLSTLQSMIPWFFAYDHRNYARYLPAYLTEMGALSSTHPEVFEYLKSGNFSVQRQSRYGFSKIACDQLIEQTLNRDSKTKGGLTGITLNKGAVNRWVLSHHERAAIFRACLAMADKDESNRSRKDLDISYNKRYEEDIQAVAGIVEAMINPFATQRDDLINISLGVVALL
jgi:hypothetical protein